MRELSLPNSTGAAIYCDLDGVLADFCGAVLRLLRDDSGGGLRGDVRGGLREDSAGGPAGDSGGGARALADWPRGTYDMASATGVELGEIWARIDAEGEGFWSQLEPFAWAAPLWEACQRAGRATILSQPSGEPASWSGKRRWVRTRLGAAQRRLMLCEHKLELLSDLGRPGAILVDDNPACCEAFIAGGGQAWLLTQPWNSPHYDAYRAVNPDPSAAIRRRLERLAGGAGLAQDFESQETGADGG